MPCPQGGTREQLCSVAQRILSANSRVPNQQHPFPWATHCLVVSERTLIRLSGHHLVMALTTSPNTNTQPTTTSSIDKSECAAQLGYLQVPCSIAKPSYNCKEAEEPVRNLKCVRGGLLFLTVLPGGHVEEERMFLGACKFNGTHMSAACKRCKSAGALAIRRWYLTPFGNLSACCVITWVLPLGYCRHAALRMHRHPTGVHCITVKAYDSTYIGL